MLDRMVEIIVEQVNPERIMLFGSRARGEAGPDSDVDLLIVEPEPFGRGRSRRRELARIRRMLAERARARGRGPPGVAKAAPAEWVPRPGSGTWAFGIGHTRFSKPLPLVMESRFPGTGTRRPPRATCTPGSG